MSYIRVELDQASHREAKAILARNGQTISSYIRGQIDQLIRGAQAAQPAQMAKPAGTASVKPRKATAQVLAPPPEANGERGSGQPASVPVQPARPRRVEVPEELPEHLRPS